MLTYVPYVLRSVATVGCAALLVAGCSASDGSEEALPNDVGGSDAPLSVEPSEEVVAALADGVVTREEYEAAFLRYSACMDKVGAPLVSVSMTSEIITYSSVAGADVDYRCLGTHFRPIDSSWQIAHPSNDSDRIRQIVRCLEEQGIAPGIGEVDPTPGADQQAQMEILVGLMFDNDLVEACNA